MTDQTLARKYRPGTFGEVIGQEAVTRTIGNSIRQGRIANAYIFCGPRGVGKTTIARLAARTLNCSDTPGKRPCGKCRSCVEISGGSNIDVLEIDGASNRGIDEIRALRENVKFSPSAGTYKIYIIDEVHMLTQEAFNALLKTLEEPPAHVKFIFATTEPHKVLPTIMSRCQRFDFKRIPPALIKDRLMFVAREEGIGLEEEAALLISRGADGSMRDGLVILDQMVSFASGGAISAGDVTELLGMLDKSSVLGLSEALIEGDTRKAVTSLDGMISAGKDPLVVADHLTGHFRDLMVLKASGRPSSDMVFTPEDLEKMMSQTEGLSLDEIIYILQVLSHARGLMRGAVFSRGPLEIAVIKIAKRKAAVSLPGMLDRLENAESSGYGRVPPSAEGNVKRPPARGPATDTVSTVRPAKTGTDAPEREEDDEGGTEEELSPSGEGTGKYMWKRVLNYIRERKMSVYTFLSPGSPVEFNDNKVIIGFSRDNAFNKEALEAESNRQVVEEAVRKITGAVPRLEFSVLDFLGGSEKKPGDFVDRRKRTWEDMKPMVERAMDVFGGQVVRDTHEERP